jgi:EAL domain-containing protein (putative c-di-GMP-specific phosphodiesterase class I)
MENRHAFDFDGGRRRGRSIGVAMSNRSTCIQCRDGEEFDVPVKMALQPIVDVAAGKVFAYEALVRGPKGEGAAEVLSRVSEKNRYTFDQTCRVAAIDLAARLRIAAGGAGLSINFLPNAVYEPRACIRLTLTAAMRTGFPLNNIIFEFTEDERLDTNHVLNILRSYRSMGFKTAIDDFGAGFAGLDLLSRFQPDLVKFDMGLIRDIDTDTAKQKIMRHCLQMMMDLGVTPLCEGVETMGEFGVLQELGVRLMQGYLFARPAIESVPAIDWPDRDRRATARM